MNDDRFGCGCFMKVHVCEEHMEQMGHHLEVLREQLALNLQCELREGREASEDGVPF